MRPIRSLVVTMIVGLAAPGSGWAGAWPREEGRTFLSFSHVPSLDRDGEFSAWAGFYAEYGATRRLTLGLDGDRPAGGENWSAWGFLRWDLAPGAEVRRAISLGAGRRGLDEGGSETVLRPGLAFGRGFDSRWGEGWLQADIQAIHAPTSGWTAWKLDATFGLKPRPGRLLMLQAQASDYPGADPQLRLVPSFVTQLSSGVNLEVGLSAEVATPQTLGVKIATWLEF